MLDEVDDGSGELAITALCGLGESLRDQADPAFRDILLTAARRARAAGDAALLARAVLADYRGIPSVVGGVDHERVELAEAALRAVGDEPTPVRARLLAHRASESAFAVDDLHRLALADEAVALARALGDPELEAWVAIRAGYALFSAPRAGELVELFREVTAIADATGDPAMRAQARYWSAGAKYTVGRLGAARSLIEDAIAIARNEGAPLYEWIGGASAIQFICMRGDVDEATAVNQRHLERGEALGAPDAGAWWASIAAMIEWSRGDWALHTPIFAAVADQYPDTPEWRGAHIWYVAQDGDVEGARRLLEVHGAALDPAALVHRPFPLHTLQELSFAAHYLCDGELARQVEDALAPHAYVWTHYFAGSIGPPMLGLAMCASARGDLDAAVERIERTKALLREQSFEVSAAWCDYFLVGFLLRRGRPGDGERARDLAQAVRASATRFNTPMMTARVDALLAG